MANDSFDFKRFKVFQGRSGMKVGTDGVLLGAWCNVPGVVDASRDNGGQGGAGKGGAADSIPSGEAGNSAALNAPQVLDIGCGTGLIALMIAQRTTGRVKIDAIDVDAGAVADTAYNFRESPWAERLVCYHIPLQEFAARNKGKYDCIVSNPPYFVDSLNSPDASRNAARHTSTLSYDELLSSVDALLADGGFFSVILPADSSTIFEKLALDKGLFCNRKLNVVPKTGVAVKRVAMQFGRTAREFSCEELIIETEGRHGYSPEYKKLTADFYLKF